MKPTMPQKTLLISGASGLLGRQTLAALQTEATLYALVRTPPAQPLPGVNYLAVDFSRPWDICRLPPKIDAVLHLAQSEHLREFPSRARDVFALNTDATSRLLDYAWRAGASHFIFTSTGGVYAPSTAPLTEVAPVAIQDGPLALYFATKYAGELLVRAYASQMHTVILRPFFMYGPGQRDTMLIPRLIGCIRRGEPVTLQGPEGIALNPIHVTDAVACLAQALTLTGTHIINLAGAEVLRIKSLCEVIAQTLGRPVVFTHAPPSTDMVASITRMSERLGAPSLTFAEGVQRL
jgi:UDP-glucose 4-epimerase